MATFTRKNQIEALQFDGKNQAEILALIASYMPVNKSTPMQNKLGDQIISIDLLNAGYSEAKISDYVIKDGDSIRVMSEKAFLAAYDPA